MGAEKAGQVSCQDDAEIIEEMRRTPKNTLTTSKVQAKVLEHKEEPVNNIQIIGWVIAGVSAFILAIAGLLYLTRDKND
jgi:hypothetical protein